MTRTLRPRRGHRSAQMSSDETDSSVPMNMGERIKVTRMSQKSIQALSYDETNLTDVSSSISNTSSNMKSAPTKFQNISDEKDDINKKSKNITNKNYQDRNTHKLNESEVDKENVGHVNQTTSSESSSSENENSYDSTESLAKSKERFLMLSNARAHKRHLDKIQICSRMIDRESRDDEFCKKNLKAGGISIKKKQKNRNVEVLPLNFKLVLEKSLNKLKNTFSTFDLHKNRLQETYLNHEVLQQEDAAHIMLMLNSVINKVQEEVNRQQYYLTKAYFQWSRKSILNNSAQNKSSKGHINNNSSEKNKLHIECSSESEEIFSPSYRYVKKPLVVTKISKRDSTLEDQNIPSDSNGERTQNQSLIKISHTSDIVGMDNNQSHDTSIQNKCPISDNSKDTIREKPHQNSIQNYVSPYKSVSCSELSEENQTENPDDLLFIIPSTPYRSERVLRNPQFIDYDSDVSSTCSTVALFSKRDYNKRKQKCKSTNNTSQVQSDSDDTIILHNTKKVNNRKRKPEVISYGSQIREPLSKLSNNSQFIVPKLNRFFTHNHSKQSYGFNSDSSIGSYPKKRKHENANNQRIIDNKLKMNCKVSIEKLRVELR